MKKFAITEATLALERAIQELIAASQIAFEEKDYCAARNLGKGYSLDDLTNVLKETKRIEEYVTQPKYINYFNTLNDNS